MAAIELGKALFWDQAVGSDGLDVNQRPIGQACASCTSTQELTAGPSRSSTRASAPYRRTTPSRRRSV